MPPQADTSEGTRVVVLIRLGREPADIVLGALDAALRSGIAGLRVRLPLDPGDARRERLEALCEADPRVEVADPVVEPSRGSIVIELPARARPEPHTLSAVLARLFERSLEQVEVRVPGRYGVLPGRPRLVARGRGSGREAMGAREVGLRSVASRTQAAPPPKSSLAAERSEHLRHRARAATMRARVSRNEHRLARERLQTRHERTRRHLAERRLGRTSAGEWVRWRSRAVGRRAAAMPGLVAAAARQSGRLARRARRYAVNRRRSRKLAT